MTRAFTIKILSNIILELHNSQHKIILIAMTVPVCQAFNNSVTDLCNRAATASVSLYFLPILVCSCTQRI